MNASKWLIHSGWESESFGDVNAGRLGMLFEVDSELLERMATDEYLEQDCVALIISRGYTHIVAYSNEYGQTWYIGCVDYSQAWIEWRNFVEDWKDYIIMYETMMNG